MFIAFATSRKKDRYIHTIYAGNAINSFHDDDFCHLMEVEFPTLRINRWSFPRPIPNYQIGKPEAEPSNRIWHTEPDLSQTPWQGAGRDN